MSQNISFWRKIGYVVAIALLLLPLFFIGHPASRDRDGNVRGGGVLAQLRQEHGLAQAALGEIDPASESMKLATLGMRGVAANLLWQKAFDYKMKEEWDNFSATTNQITKLQPNYIMIWEFQAHNLAYNVSTEFDDYRHRYHWVKKGLSFLIEGTHHNRGNPRLLHYTGWITGQKIGRADERVQFREMFREDDDFHDELNTEVLVDDAVGYDGRPDSWLVSRLWYLRAERSVDEGNPWRGKNVELYNDDPLRGKSPLIFRNDAPMSLINYASTIEEEGVHGQTAQFAWRDAGNGWRDFGTKEIPTSWGHLVRLGEYDKVGEDIVRMREVLAEIAPGVRERIRKEKIAALTQDERDALKVPEEDLTEDNYRQHYEAQNKTAVTHAEVAENADEAVRDRAVRLASRLADQELLSRRISSYRSIINYDYWKIRCEAEQTLTAVKARECIYEAKKSEDKTEVEKACEWYQEAWGLWREVFDKYPRLKDDVESEELVKSIKRYRRLLRAFNQDLPQDFILRDLLEDHDDFVDLFRPTADQGEKEADSTEDEDESGDAKTGDDPPASDTTSEPAPDTDPSPE